MPDIWAGVNWNCFISVKLPSNIHLRCFWTRETLQKDCLSQGHMVHLKSSPPACPEGKKKSKKELDRHLTLNKYPAENTFLVRVNSPIKKQQNKQKSLHLNEPSPQPFRDWGCWSRPCPAEPFGKICCWLPKHVGAEEQFCTSSPKISMHNLRAKTPLY